MTQDEFFEALAECKDFKRMPAGELRAVYAGEIIGSCPICEVTYRRLGKRYPNTLYMSAGKALGMNHADVERIGFAADTPYSEHDSNTLGKAARRRLLKTLGLGDLP